MTTVKPIYPDVDDLEDENDNQRFIEAVNTLQRNGKPVNTYEEKTIDVNRLKRLIEVWEFKARGKEHQPRWSNVVKLLEELKKLE